MNFTLLHYLCFCYIQFETLSIKYKLSQFRISISNMMTVLLLMREKWQQKAAWRLRSYIKKNVNKKFLIQWKMNQQCICDYSSEEYSEDKKDEQLENSCNRIFLNFTREYRNPAKDRYNQEKVRKLFQYLRERSDLQEMRVSGWLGRISQLNLNSL